MRRDRVRPRPVPSSRELPRPPCWKDSKIRSRSASGTPMPVSLTVISISGPERSARTTTEPPSPVNLTALVIRLSTTCLSRSSSEYTGPTSALGLDPEVDAVRRGALAEHGHRVLEQCAKIEGGVLELHPPGFDLRQVQDLVEQLQQVLAGSVDVAQVLLLPLVDVAEHALQENFGEAEHRIERGAQLVRHARQELRLVPARELELEALLLQLPVQLRVEQRQGGLACERFQQVDGLLGEVAGALPTDDQGADDLALAEHGYGDQRAPAGVPQDLQVRIRLDGARGRRRRSGDVAWPPGRRASRRGRSGSSAAARPPRDRSGRRPARGSSGRLDVLHDRAAVGLGQLDGVLGDRVEDVVDVQAGADGLADHPQRLQLVDLLGEFGLACLELLHELDAIDRHGRLNGERADDRHLPVVERVDVVAPDAEPTDHLVVEDHRGAHRGAEAGRTLAGRAGRTPGPPGRPGSVAPVGRARPGR